MDATLGSLRTPALLLDLAVLERNLARMAERARRLGVALRPHVKTHKCVQVAARQRALGARGMTVSTLDEARAFAAAGFDDLLWAFPVPLSRVDEAVALSRGVSLGLTVDSLEATEALLATGAPLGIWLKVDCGYHRVGVDPEGELGVAIARRVAASPHARFAGVLTHAGHSYACRGGVGLEAIAEAERDAVVSFRARLAALGLSCPDVSVGSTPTLSVARDLAGVTEVRPGNYCFYDGSQVAIGSCAPDDCALTVLSTVISSQPGAAHAVLDAGALALSKDLGPGDVGYGPVVDLEGASVDGAHVRSVSQEHGVVDRPLAVGTRVRVVANHSCLTAACFDRYHVVSAGRVVDEWPIHRLRT